MNTRRVGHRSSPVEDGLMDRNANEGNQSGSGTGSSGTSGFGASGAGAGGYGSAGGTSPGTSGESFGGTSAGTSSSSGLDGGSYGSTGSTGAAKDKLGEAREKLGHLKGSLADKLEAGAEKLRARTQSGTYAGDTGSGSAAVSSDTRMTEVSNRVAGGLQASADWIREADVDSMRTGIETQVKEHPGRTLLIAAGLGYLLGKAFRR